MTKQDKISVPKGTTDLLKKIRKHTEDYGLGNLGFIDALAVLRLKLDCDEAFSGVYKKKEKEFMESLINDTMMLENEGVSITNLRNVQGVM